MNRATALLAGTLFLNSVLCHSGQQAGNGGDVVVCRESSGAIRTIELLDFYEARILRGIHKDLGGASTWHGKVELALSRLARISSNRSTQYREWANSFISDSIFLAGVTLTDVPDSQHLTIPAGCSVEQIAIQRTPVFPQDKRYTVSQDLWNALDEDGKAGLILHEVIYQEAAYTGHQNSISTRYLNSLISSRTIETLTHKQFYEFLFVAPFSAWTMGAFNFHLGDLYRGDSGEEAPVWLNPTIFKFYPNGSLENGWLKPGTYILADGKTLTTTKNCFGKFDRESRLVRLELSSCY